MQNTVSSKKIAPITTKLTNPPYFIGNWAKLQSTQPGLNTKPCLSHMSLKQNFFSNVKLAEKLKEKGVWNTSIVGCKWATKQFLKLWDLNRPLFISVYGDQWSWLYYQKDTAQNGIRRNEMTKSKVPTWTTARHSCNILKWCSNTLQCGWE